MKIDIEDLKKIKIDKDDVLFFRVKNMSKELADETKKILDKMFPDNKIVILNSKNTEFILAQAHRDFDEVTTL